MFDGEGMVRILELLITERDTLGLVVIRRTLCADMIKAGRKANQSGGLKDFLLRTYIAWSERPL